MANKVFINDFENKDFFTPLQNSLIEVLENDGPSTRRELVKLLKTPRTTIYDNLLKLQKKMIIEKFSRNNGRRGRPLVFWKLKE
jgi:predicted ArsR family transcriptional regulator